MIKEEHIYSGSGGIYVVTSDNEGELKTYLEAKQKGIDFMRSPYILGISQLPSGEYKGQLKYYGLD